MYIYVHISIFIKSVFIFRETTLAATHAIMSRVCRKDKYTYTQDCTHLSI